MTSSVAVFTYMPSIGWLILTIALFALNLTFIVRFIKPYDEMGEPIVEQEVKPQTKQDKLRDWLISIFIFILIVGILRLILLLIGNQIVEQVNQCANCTIALNGGLR